MILLDDDKMYQAGLLTEADCNEMERLFRTYRDDIFYGDSDLERHLFASDMVIGRKRCKAQAKKILIQLQAIYNIPDLKMEDVRLGEFIQELMEEF